MASQRWLKSVFSAVAFATVGCAAQSENPILQGVDFDPRGPARFDQTIPIDTRLMLFVASCWKAPLDVPNAEELLVSVSFKLDREGRLTEPPIVLPRAGGLAEDNQHYLGAVDHAVQAVIECQPYDFLPPEDYDNWKDVRFNFDPRPLVEAMRSDP